MKRGKLFYGVALTVICLLCSFMFVACKPDTSNGNPPAGTLTISQTTAQLDMHEQVQLTVAETGDTTWESGNTAVCTVENGLVKSVGVGVTTVTASQGDKKATCTVTVTNSRSAAQIVLTDGQATISGQKICSESDEFTLNADVKYKNTGVAAADVAELQWSVDDDEILSLTVSDDKKSANIVCLKFGFTTVRVATTVWGEPISKAIEVFVRNTNVTFSSEQWEKDEEVYSVQMNTVEENGTAVTMGLDIVCKDGATDVTNQVKWSASKPGVVTVADNMLTAVAAGSVSLTGEYQANLVTVEVRVTKPTFTLAEQAVSLFGGKGDELRTSYPTADEVTAMRARNVTLDLPDTVAGTVSEFNMTYKQAVGGSTEVVTRNILESVDGKKVSVRPSFYSFNLGAQQATVVTDKAVYTLPLELYTMIIDSKEDLDAFRYYTTYQNEWKETKDKGVFAPILWDGYFVLGDNITYNDKDSNNNFKRCQNGSNSGEDFSKINRYTSFITGVDMYAFMYSGLKTNRGGDASLDDILSGNCSSALGDFGFCGIFDGQGYNIEGLFIQNEGEKDDWTGDIKNEGGFIGVLTSHTFGSDTVYGTIRNLSFTEVVHGECWDNSKLYGTGGAFLYSGAHAAVVENINIHAALRRGSFGMLGAGSWHTQLTGNSVLRNVLITVDADRIQYGENDTKPVIVGHGFNLAAYENTTLKNLYVVVGAWDEGIKADGTANQWGSSGAGAQDTEYGCKVLSNNGNNTTPAKACASFAELKGIIETADNASDWDSEYWEFAAAGDKVGTPVFKTKTND